MSPTARLTSLPARQRRLPATKRPRVALYGRDGSEGAASRKKVSDRAPAMLDLAARVRVHQRALRRRAEHRDTLLDVVRGVGATLDPMKIADHVVQLAPEWIPAPSWALVSRDESGQLLMLADRGVDPPLVGPLRDIAQWVMNRGEDLVSADVSREARVPGQPAASILAFPLTSRGIRVGALVGLDPVPSARPLRLGLPLQRAVRTLLEPVAAALDTALRLQRVQALSVTDDLTTLHNSRYLNQVLRRETKRASRSGKPLSLLFVDLDGFKDVNDTHGHLCGSRALVEAADVIKGIGRETDVVARFGGDEFALVLPETGGDGAMALGTRLRQKVANHRFLAADRLDIRLTASVGVATFPDVAASADELIQAADAAMYQVKKTGKNGIQAATVPADSPIVVSASKESSTL